MNRAYHYLASPYTHPDLAVRVARYEAVVRAAGGFLKSGIYVHSPICHSHPIAMTCGLPIDSEFWREYNVRVLRPAESLIVLMMTGWEESEGVQFEIRVAEDLGKQIYYIDPRPDNDYSSWADHIRAYEDHVVRRVR